MKTCGSFWSWWSSGVYRRLNLESLTKIRSKVPATSLSVVKGPRQILQGREAAVGCGEWEESTGIGCRKWQQKWGNGSSGSWAFLSGEAEERQDGSSARKCSEDGLFLMSAQQA